MDSDKHMYIFIVTHSNGSWIKFAIEPRTATANLEPSPNCSPQNIWPTVDMNSFGGVRSVQHVWVVLYTCFAIFLRLRKGARASSQKGN